MILDFADIKPSVLNWAIVGTMAITFITFWRYVFSRWNVPYVGQLFASV